MMLDSKLSIIAQIMSNDKNILYLLEVGWNWLSEEKKFKTKTDENI